MFASKTISRLNRRSPLSSRLNLFPCRTRGIGSVREQLSISCAPFLECRAAAGRSIPQREGCPSQRLNEGENEYTKRRKLCWAVCPHVGRRSQKTRVQQSGSGRCCSGVWSCSFLPRDLGQASLPFGALVCPFICRVIYYYYCYYFCNRNVVGVYLCIENIYTQIK